MKLLENSTFYALSSALSAETLDCRLETRLESYSCKLVGDEKKTWKELGGSPNEREALSPPQMEEFFLNNPSPTHMVSRASVPSSDPDTSADVRFYFDEFYIRQPENDNNVVLCDSLSRKTLFYLTSTLNRSFPDYDFNDAKGESFSREPSIQYVLRAVDGKLGPVVENYGVLQASLWAAIDKEIHMSECTVYAYSPDYTSDPFSAEGALWSFNYFFYNKALKRLVFFTCRAFGKLAPVLPEEYTTQWSMEEP